MKSFIEISVVDRQEKIGSNKLPVKVVEPRFTTTGKDLMKKGGEFYAVLNEETGMWITDELYLYEKIDAALYKKREEIGREDSYGNYFTEDGYRILVSSIEDSSTNQLYKLKKWMQSLPKNFNYIPLDDEITFVDEEVTPEMYRSKRLRYSVAPGGIDSYEKLFGTLYSEEEKRKLEWEIGSVFAKKSKNIEKFVAIYGPPGSGKSTVMDLLKDLFEGYYSIFVASEIANKSNQFSTEYFRDNPLVAIQDDGSLSKIDSSLMNEIISHKEIAINEKGMKKYSMRANAVLFMATNDTVDIHDTGKGVVRRLLDVYPSGNKLPVTEYRKLVNNLRFELGAIAYHCMEVFNRMGVEYYNDYKPVTMIKKTNYIRNFLFDNFERMTEFEYYTRNELYLWYKNYCEESNFQFFSKRNDFGDQISEYFREYYEIKTINGKTSRHVYSGFKSELFAPDYAKGGEVVVSEDKVEIPGWLNLDKKKSLFDELYSGCAAQYATEDGKPGVAWSKCETVLKDIDTKKEHFVRPPENLIVIDFDIKDEDGNKDEKRNLEAASKWPKTYAEYSRSGGGVHLHYIYNGDVGELKPIIDKDVECKIFTGRSALRRRLSGCNEEAITIISSGLPLKEGKVITEFKIKDEKHLRNLIRKAIKKETNLGGTKPNVDYISHLLKTSYDSGMKYDVSDLAEDIQTFAMNSTHHSTYCLTVVSNMKFKSDEPSENTVSGEYNEKPIIFFDIECFPNLFIICWKYAGEDKEVVRMINPDPLDVEALTKYRLIGFNNRNYDNHMIYARMMGYNNEQLYRLSQTIISSKKNEGKFGEAYNLSYTDVYDFLSSANKMSLKKWEIALGIHHQENEYPWDEPVPKSKWMEIADYCANDVIATEKVFEANEADWLAREILADLADLTVNDTTNKCTTKIIVGDSKNPQFDYIYTDLSTIFPGYEFDAKGIAKERYNEGTKIVAGKSIYRGEDPGEGGYVFANPGIHKFVALLDVASMHPHSAIRLKIFGEFFTKRFEELVEARVAIKHGDFEQASKMLDGKLKPYLKNKKDAKKLANALKTAINSVYGLTSASFDNKLRDPRNVDNIVAKYGALFMINLKHEVQDRGYTVVHIKTDSIKIADADNEIISFVNEYGKKYGFTFEHEATYEKMCLVNDAVYVARYISPEWCMKKYNYIPEDCEKHNGEWTATGTQFQVPYVFKTMFSHEEIKLEDMSVVNSVSTKLYLDMNEGMAEDEHNYKFVGRVGQFTPVISGAHGGILLRWAEGDKYSAATGSKGYRWMETEMVKALPNCYDIIDRSYFNKLVDKAVAAIEEFGNYRDFISDEVPDFLKIPDGAEPAYDFMNPPIAA